MKKIMIIVALLSSTTLFVGCGDTTGDGATVSVDCGAGGCGDVTLGDGNTQTTNTTPSKFTTPSVEFNLDNYDATLDAASCRDLGFFFCTIEQKCLPKPLKSGSCPNKSSESNNTRT